MNKNNVIYAYKKKDENHIVYIGQTVNLKNRHYRHMKIDPWDATLIEYNYPLSRGIRKYGVNAYELMILEDNIPFKQLDIKEKFYIEKYDTYYHGYNQTIGGTNRVMPTYEENIINKVIELLQDYSIKFEDISKETGLSLTHIYNINSGERRRRDNLIYPIRPSNVKGTRGLKFSPEEIKEIHNLILNSSMTFKSIAEKYKCTDTTIRRINKGTTQAYILKEYNYPLRKR